MNIETALVLVNSAPLLGAAVTLAAIWWRGRTERFALSWALAFAVGLVAMPMFLVARPPFTIFTGGGMVLGNVLLNLAFYLLAQGTAYYAGQRMAWRRWLVGGAGVATLSALALLRSDIVLFEVLNGVFVQATCAVAIFYLWRVRPRGGPEWTLIGAFVAIFVARALFVVDVVVTRPGDSFDASMLGNLLSWVLQPFVITAISGSAVVGAVTRIMRQQMAERRAALHVAEEARAADRAKSEFLATISHEIRTPINAIQGCLQILETHNLNAAQIRLLEVMGGAGTTLLALIDDVLDMARLEAGRLELLPGPVDLGLLLGDIMSTVGPKAERKGLELSLRTGEGVPSAVVTDAKRLRQILLCLLDNAVKFTDLGRIGLSVDRTSAPGDHDSGSGPWIRFQVTDTGVGIPADKIDRIFEAFSQADNSITRRFGGAGLGLAIARSLADMLGGSLTVESGQDEGSQFTLCIPLQTAEAGALVSGGQRPAAAIPAVKPALAPRSGRPVVMIVEEDEVNRYLAGEMLTGQGMEVVGAGNGGEALALVERRRVDAVIIDLTLPDMEGVAAINNLRRRLGAGVAILALSAQPGQQLRDACHAAGADIVLSKPLRFDSLMSALTGLMPQATTPAA